MEGKQEPYFASFNSIGAEQELKNFLAKKKYLPGVKSLHSTLLSYCGTLIEICNTMFGNIISKNYTIRLCSHII